MADDNSGGCAGGIFMIIFFIMMYFYGLDLLKDVNGQSLWWHYLLAFPLGLLLIWLFSGLGVVFIFKWLLIPLGGILVMIWLLRKGFYGWTSGAGVGYLILGVFCASQAKREESRPWAFNGLCACILGLIMIIAGFVVRFF